MNLSEQIKNYYFERLDELPQDKQFHFASRTAAWLGDDRSFQALNRLKDYIAPEGELEKVILDLLATKSHKGINAYEARLPYFNKYPDLYGIHSTLFRVRHLKSVYGIDAKDILFRNVGRDHLDQLATEIMTDPDALSVLSTYAINFLYLYKYILLEDRDYIDLDSITALKDCYRQDEPHQKQLLIYLYTHCVIGASNFYTQELPKQDISKYQRMLDILEPMIIKRFEYINLDNKLEFLVSARIAGFKTRLDGKIYEECERSLSPHGCFLIDLHNKNAQKDRVSFDKSEHRNVLFLMSCSPFSPHSTLI
jgi:hypothetical protein